jgi:hypothetical protein
MIEFSLYENGAFVLPVLDTFSNTAVIQNEEDVPVALVEPEEVHLPAAPAYREREWMMQQAAGIPCSVGIFRAGRYKIRNATNEILRLTAVKVVPYDVEAAMLALDYMTLDYDKQEIVVGKTGKKKLKKTKHGDVQEFVDGSSHLYQVGDLTRIQRCCVVNPIKDDGSNPLPKGVDKRLYFPINNLLGPDPENSFLMRHLQRFGFNPILSPSLAGWLKREHLRRQIDMTPFNLPEVKDSRPLFEKVESGLILRCKQATGQFVADTHYVVVGTAIQEDQDDAEGQEIVRLKASTDSPYKPALEWTPFDGKMDDYFELEYENEVVYDPEQCIPAKFPALYQMAQKRLDRLKLPLFNFAGYDAAQVSVKDHAYFGYPIRMGKTRAALATSLVWGSKRVGFVSPGIARMDVWSELDKIGRQHEAKIVKSVNDLEGDSRFFLMTLPWLKYKEDPFKGQRYEFPAQSVCPHCGQDLARLTKTGFGQLKWTTSYGYRCINTSCSYYTKTKIKHHGHGCKGVSATPWQDKHLVGNSADWTNAKGQDLHGGYVDYEGAKHIKNCIVPILKMHMEEKDEQKKIAELFRGRQCKCCGFVAQAWKPPRYRRVSKYRWGTMVVDEIHAAKNHSSDQGQTILSLSAKHRLGLTGTLMPNTPSDPYWPLHWIFGGATHRFPYFRSGEQGLIKWNKDFTKVIEVADKDSETVKHRRLPYLAAPLAFWKLLSPMMVRRTYEDQMVKDSLEAAGLHYPTVVPPKTILCDPDPKQAALLLGTMEKFAQKYNELKASTEKEGKQLKAQTVLAAMSLMKVVATCPDHLNVKLAEHGIDQKIYTGVRGGGKMKDIRNLVWTKIQQGEKVVILSFYREMLNALNEELAEFNPIKFDPKWDEETRYEKRMLFQNPDSGHQVFIAGINTVQVSVDLSAANTVICADLLWTPGLQAQAWSRILQATPVKRTCEIYLMLLKHSIDRHIYNVFYSKLVAAEQAFDRQVTTKKDKGLDIQWFVDEIMSDQPKIIEYLIEAGESEVNYVPLLEMLNFDDHED